MITDEARLAHYRAALAKYEAASPPDTERVRLQKRMIERRKEVMRAKMKKKK